MCDRLLLADATLLDPEAPDAAPARASLLVERGRIAARLPAEAAGPEDAERVSLAGGALSPGLIDLHWHGDLVLRPAGDAADALAAASAALVRSGVTGFLPTTVAWPADELAARVEALAAAIGGPHRWPGALPLGLHLEGPWIRAEAAGAQPPAGIRPYDPAEGADVLARAAGLLRMVTLAPELPGAPALLDALARAGAVAALGHTLADADAIGRAIDRGVTHVTHLFNAMGPLHQRLPGVAASVLAEDRLGCDVIADGAHVHPAWLRVAARAKGERLLLITDALEAPRGSDHARPQPSPATGGFGAHGLVSDGTAWRLPDGRLAGSHLRLHDAVRNVVRWRVMTRHDALAAATVRPARLLGIEAERGTLRPGARADLVLWSDAGDLAAVWIGGRLAFSAGEGTRRPAR